MRRLFALLAIVACGAVALGLTAAAADAGDGVQQSASTTLVGGQVTLDLTVVTPPGATVEVNPGASSWSGLEIISVGRDITRTQGGNLVHTIRVVVAAFEPGALHFQPALTVVQGTDSLPRLLPEVQLQVSASLGPNDRLELSPLPPPGPIGGAESPLLKPAIAFALVCAVLLVALLATLLARAVLARTRTPRPAAPVPNNPESPIAHAEALMQADPMEAYRMLGRAVRTALAKRYELPAPALTTRELQLRMIDSGVDRLQARMVSGLLDECDAVLYGGYRPASARRFQDLGIAREIVEEAT